MTEERACTKWCPFAHGRTVIHGRVTKRDEYSDRCIASDCMAWRWSFDIAGERDFTDGYCGLASGR